NTKNFPDGEFRAYVSSSFDKDQDDILSSTEVDAITDISVPGITNLKNLKGMEYFKNVTRIDASNTSLEEIDISKNTALTSISVGNTPLEEIDVSKNTALLTLYCYDMPNLTKINVQGASALQNLQCYNNPKLKGLDVSGNSDLRNLWIKDSSYTGTNLLWLKMGAHPNLSSSSSYYKNATSTITIGEVAETFNLKDISSEIELDRITNITGADIDLTTGVVSNYQDFDRTQLITYTYRSGTIQSNSAVSLTVQLSIETQALPQGQEIVVAQGKEANPADGIANKDLLKEGATYAWEGDAPDTSEIGVVTGNIIVSYPDGSSHKVENVRVNVGIELNTKNFPDGEFRSYIGNVFDKNQDDILSSTEVDAIT
ncbi:MAG: hypothetical protein K2F55_02875, partial [Erysipelotrichaceae bacterium]|nr:hypothetical protein [Erysipelotrichaceae bacterium]